MHARITGFLCDFNYRFIIERQQNLRMAQSSLRSFYCVRRRRRDDDTPNNCKRRKLNSHHLEPLDSVLGQDCHGQLQPPTNGNAATSSPMPESGGAILL